MKPNKIHRGNCLELLKKTPDSFVDCVVTSPPYWALRDYGVEGQLGLEPTFEEYTTKLCDIFDEVKRVLKPTGTCWVNIGDTYMGNSSYSEGGRQGFDGSDGHMNQDKWPDPKYKAAHGKRLRAREHVKRTIKPKSLAGIPFRFAIEMINRGWVLRNTIIWHKPNCMPSSAQDRFTVDFEYVFLFSKEKKYYFEKQSEPWTDERKSDIQRAMDNHKGYQGKYGEGYNKDMRKSLPGQGIKGQPVGDPISGRNKRCVWKIPTQPLKEAHFATFPEDLIEPMIKAGVPEFVCNECGKAREKILAPSDSYRGYSEVSPYRGTINPVEFGQYIRKMREKRGLSRSQVDDMLGTNTALSWWEGRNYRGEFRHQLPNPENYKKLKEILVLDGRYDKAILTVFEKTKKGWVSQSKNSLVEGNRKTGKSLVATYKTIGYSSCSCNAGFSPGIVLDPFMGAGTTALVSKKLDRNFLGFELNEEYIKIANKRIRPWMEQQKLK